MYAACMSVCVCVCGLGEELLCCDGSLCGAGLNVWLYWSSAETRVKETHLCMILIQRHVNTPVYSCVQGHETAQRREVNK